jgi:hypothetical protein
MGAERVTVGSYPTLAMLVATCAQLLQEADAVVDLAAEDVGVGPDEQGQDRGKAEIAIAPQYRQRAI